jgi:hypothetical protein
MYVYRYNEQVRVQPEVQGHLQGHEVVSYVQNDHPDAPDVLFLENLTRRHRVRREARCVRGGLKQYEKVNA